MSAEKGTWARTLGIGVLLLPCLAWGDEVHLRGGGRVTGVVVERTERVVVLETGPGRISVALDRVERIVDSRSALESYRQRASALDAGDVEGWARLARWAKDHDLATAATEAWERVLALDPGHPEANEALGRLYVDGQWLAEAEARRALGFVPWQGSWVTPAEHEALVRERGAAQQEALDRREAELRVREAEARAREAEARAREAEAMAEQAGEPGDGIPYSWVLYGGGRGAWLPGGAGCCRPAEARPPHGGLPGQPVHPPVAAPLPSASVGPVSGHSSARATSPARGAIGVSSPGGGAGGAQATRRD